MAPLHVLPPPNINADTHGACRLFDKLAAQGPTGLDEDKREWLCRIQPDGKTVQFRVGEEGAGDLHLSRRKRRAMLHALVDGIRHAAGPSGKVQELVLVSTQHGGVAQFRAEHPKRRADRLLMVRYGGERRQNIRHERNACRAVAVDSPRHAGDEVAVAQAALSLRHTDEHRVPRVGNVDEPLVRAWKINAHIIKRQSDLAAVSET